MKNLILASSSPRRKWLLKESGLSFRIVKPDVDETPLKNEKPKALVKRLSKDKALHVFKKIKNNNVQILAADTIVVSPNKKIILGKPRNKKEAFWMLQTISGKIHEVVTGYCIVKFVNGKKSVINKTVTTKVKIKKMNKHEILQYLDKGESMDKAGAYAAQGFGMTIIEKVNGSFTNVVGLPLSEVHHDLKR